MITLQQALTVREFHHATDRNADGTPVRARRNGKTQTWKREPARFRIPAKQGMYTYGNITDADACEWFDNPADAMAEGIKRERERVEAIEKRRAMLADIDARR